MSPILIPIAVNQYSRDLSTHVQRGMNGKRAEGWYPHRAPEGYLNNLAIHTIESDLERFALLRQAWELMLTGSYSIAQVLQILNGEWGYRTRGSGKHPSGPLSRSGLYRIFNSVFYTGRWIEKGVLYQCKHSAMVSIHEYNRVQAVLGRPGKAQQKVHRFAYTGLIRCTGCDCAVSGELQHGRHGRGHYIYYHCSNARKQCGRVSISEGKLEKQIDALLQRITIHPVVKEIALREIGTWQKSESGERETIFAQQQKALLEAERKMNRLVQMYLNELFDSDEEYKARKAELQAEINRLRLQVEASREEFAQITQTAENAFHFAAHARENFLLGSLERKREIARALGLNYSFYRGEVTIDLHPALAAIYDLKTSLQSGCIEPRIIGSESTKADAIASAVPLG